MMPKKPTTFTLKREEFKKACMDNERLVQEFAFWLSGMGNRFVSSKNFEEDLSDCVALLTVLSMIHGSGVKEHSYHKIAPRGSVKQQENFVTFRLSLKRLNLPESFEIEDLENKNTPQILSCLIFLSHLSFIQGIGQEGMGEIMLEKIEEIENALEDSFGGPMNIDSTAQTMEETVSEMRDSMKRNVDLISKGSISSEEEEASWLTSIYKYVISLRKENNTVVVLSPPRERLRVFKESSTWQKRMADFAHDLDALSPYVKRFVPMDAIKSKMIVN